MLARKAKYGADLFTPKACLGCLYQLKPTGTESDSLRRSELFLECLHFFCREVRRSRAFPISQLDMLQHLLNSDGWKVLFFFRARFLARVITYLGLIKRTQPQVS